MGKQKTWEQYFRRESNKLQVIDDFIAVKLEEVVTAIETDGISGRLTLLLLNKIDKEFNYLAQATEVEEGFKIKDGWFRSVLLQTCLKGKDTVHFGFTQKVNELYHLLQWDFVDAVSPKCSDLEEVINVTWTNSGGISYIDVVVYPSSEFPVGSIWCSSSDNRWEVLEVEKGAVKMANIEQWGNGREMTFSDRVVRSMKRVI